MAFSLMKKNSFIKFPSGHKFNRKNFNNAPDKKASVFVSGKLFRDNLEFVIKEGVCAPLLSMKKKRFYNFDPWCQFYKTFLLMLQTNKLERLSLSSFAG